MKKILISIFALVFSSSMASAAVNIGVSYSAAGFAVTGTETESDEKNTESEIGAAAYGSIFIEKTLGDRFTLGVDYVPSALSTDTIETAKSDMGVAAQSQTTVTNKVQVDFEDMTTFYAGLMVTDNLYVKAGIVQVDVITNENMGTGAKYGNTDMDGSMFGVGYHMAADNGVFFRVEGTYMDLGGANLTSTGTASTSKITISSLDGVTGKISLGKSF